MRGKLLDHRLDVEAAAEKPEVLHDDTVRMPEILQLMTAAADAAPQSEYPGLSTAPTSFGLLNVPPGRIPCASVVRKGLAGLLPEVVIQNVTVRATESVLTHTTLPICVQTPVADV
jgi:hypothetical protein